MNIGILCHELGEVESNSLVEAAAKLGHVPIPFTLEEVRFSFDRTGLTARLGDGYDLQTLDLILSRAKIAAQYSMIDADRYGMLCNLGVPVSDLAGPFLTAESKLATMGVLAAAGVPLLATEVCQDIHELRRAIAACGDAVVKSSFGYGGENVMRITGETKSETLAAILDRYGQLLVQEYVPHDEGDYRVTLAGRELLFVARRIPNSRSWKANVSSGADVRIIEHPPEEVCALGIRAADALGLFLAGVDILPYRDSYVVLEVNNCPGWTDLDRPFKAQVSERILREAIARVVQ